MQCNVFFTLGAREFKSSVLGSRSVGTIEKRAGDERGLVEKEERSPALYFSLPYPARRPPAFSGDRPHCVSGDRRLRKPTVQTNVTPSVLGTELKGPSKGSESLGCVLFILQCFSEMNACGLSNAVDTQL